MRDITGPILAAGGAVTVELLKHNISAQQGVRIAGSVVADTLKDIARRKFNSSEVAAYLAVSGMYEILVAPLIADLKQKYSARIPHMSDRELHLITQAAFTLLVSFGGREIGLFPAKPPQEILIDAALSSGGRYVADKYL
jgi:hypothetical protein